MKKVSIVVILALLLSGCADPALETVSDVYMTQPPAEIRTISLELPEDAAEAVMEGGDGARLYLCDGYELRLQTVDARSAANRYRVWGRPAHSGKDQGRGV